MPRSASTRERISAAALLVKVTARMRSGSESALADEVRNSVSNDACLARAGARQDEKRTLRLENSIPLFGIET